LVPTTPKKKPDPTKLSSTNPNKNNIMKKIHKLLALAAVSALGITSAAQAATTVQVGDWNDPATWGGTLPSNTGEGDNNVINHAVTVTDSRVVRDLNLFTTETGSISVTGAGNLELAWDVNLGVQTWDTSSGYTFNFDGRQLRFRSDGGVWTHNGDLDLLNADIYFRPGNNHTGTINGTGTLSLNQMIFNNSSSTLFNVDRNVIADDLIFDGTFMQTMNILGGVFQLDNSLTALSANNIVNFGSTDAIFRVLGTAFSETDATTAIDEAYITSDVGALNVSTDGLYTVIAVPEPGSYALIAGMLGLAYAMVRRRRN
jgi:hypothetical protein